MRQEGTLIGELGVSGMTPRRAWILGGWVETTTQWEPRDADGKDGVDRRYTAAGLRITRRAYQSELSVPEAIAEQIRRERAANDDANSANAARDQAGTPEPTEPEPLLGPVEEPVIEPEPREEPVAVPVEPPPADDEASEEGTMTRPGPVGPED